MTITADHTAFATRGVTAPDRTGVAPVMDDAAGTESVAVDAIATGTTDRVHQVGTALTTLVVVLTELALLHVVYVHAPSVLVADLIYVALLAVASFGWMFWFRRLVLRHRTLERAITEERASTVGAQRLAALVRHSADVVLVGDRAGRIEYASPSTLSAFGIPPADMIDRPLADLIETSERTSFAMLVALVPDGAETGLTARVRHADGRLVDVEGTIANLCADPAIGGVVITMRDVTERVRLEQALTRQAFHDALTDLANRQLFSDRLEHALLPRRTGEARSLVVLFCDLDEFKNINDSRGHSVGDKVLVEIARRARFVVRADDTVARFGGDEFAVLLENTDADQAFEVAERLRREISRPITIDGEILGLGVSIGLAAAPVAGDFTGEELLRNADVAMYLAKSRGKGTIAVYDAKLHADALRTIEMHETLAAAIEAGELAPHFQPIMDLRTGRTSGFEALARWQPATGPAIPPNEFIPVAEQSGAIYPLGLSILESACRHGVEFAAISGDPLLMSVNVTVGQLRRERFVADVLAILDRTGLPPTSLQLEITESELATELAVVEKQLRALRAIGIRIAIDDFGTGFSSLAYLRDLPIDTLKVDKRFIDRIAEDSHDAALALAVITLSTSVRLTAVAEGVEHADQASFLAGTSCSYAQGFLWSRALPPQDAAAWLASRLATDPDAPADDAPPTVVAPVRHELGTATGGR